MFAKFHFINDTIVSVSGFFHDFDGKFITLVVCVLTTIIEE